VGRTARYIELEGRGEGREGGAFALGYALFDREREEGRGKGGIETRKHNRRGGGED